MTSAASLGALDEKKTAFLVCDMQTRLLKVMRGAEEIVRASKRLVSKLHYQSWLTTLIFFLLLTSFLLF